jgi:hypothetical protein
MAKKGKVVITGHIDDTAKYWFKVEKYGQYIITIVTILASVVCTLWILGYFS